MKIKHVRPFATGLLCCVLTAGVLLLALVQGPSPRHLIGAAILAALGAVEFWFAFSKNSLDEEMGIKADERALFIATKSGHLALRILNGLLLAGPCWPCWAMASPKTSCGWRWPSPCAAW